MNLSRRELLRLIGATPLVMTGVNCDSSTEELPMQKENLSFFIGTSTEGDSQGIYLGELNQETGLIENLELAAEIDHPNFIAINKSKDRLYAVSQDEDMQGIAKSYSIGQDLSLSLTGETLTGSGSLAHIDVSPNNRSLAVANYYNGNVSLVGLDGSGDISSSLDLAQHEGSSVDIRQEAPHAHCTIFSEDSRFLYVADLGIDKVVIYEVDHDNTKLLPASSPDVSLAPGAGPRHFKIHPNSNRAFVINELNNTVTSFVRDEGTGALETIESVSTLPEGYSETAYTSDLHISSDGKFIYGANRGHNSIAVLKFENDSMELIQTISTRGDWPRNFALDPSENFLIVGNRRTNDFSVYERDENTGMLTSVGNLVSQPSPICMLFV